MKKFLELHTEGKPFLMNANNIRWIDVTEKTVGCRIVMTDDYDVEVSESYDTVKKMIGDMQGGIPLEPSRAY